RLGFLYLLLVGAATRLLLCGAGVKRLLRDGEVGLKLCERLVQPRRVLLLLRQIAIECRAPRALLIELFDVAASGRVGLLTLGFVLPGRAPGGCELFLQLCERVAELSRSTALCFERGVELRVARTLFLDGALELFDLTAGGSVGRFGGERLFRSGELA